MSAKKTPSPAEIFEKAMQRIALGVLLVSLANLMKILKYVLSPDFAAALDMAELGLGALAVIVVLPHVIKLVALKMRLPSCEHEPEGFLVDVYKRAAEKGFAFTFIFLLFMNFMTSRSWAEFPAELVIEIIIAVSLAIFGVSFFVISRSYDDDENDEDFEDAFDNLEDSIDSGVDG